MKEIHLKKKGREDGYRGNAANKKTHPKVRPSYLAVI
jgi:hypothetical protein